MYVDRADYPSTRRRVSLGGRHHTLRHALVQRLFNATTARIRSVNNNSLFFDLNDYSHAFPEALLPGYSEQSARVVRVGHVNRLGGDHRGQTAENDAEYVQQDRHEVSLLIHEVLGHGRQVSRSRFVRGRRRVQKNIERKLQQNEAEY